MVEEVYSRLKEVQREDWDRLKKILLVAGALGTVWTVSEAMMHTSDRLCLA